MDYAKLRQVKAIEAKNKQRLLSTSPKLNEKSGIYFLTRVDENGFKYAYIGQAKHILTRLAQHMTGYQHIDLSIKKHGLYSRENEHGRKVNHMNYPVESLDSWEKFWIKQYADKGYQLRNKTSGSQGEGKVQIDEYRPAKGYRDGLEQGRKNLAKELLHIIDKHLVVCLKPEKAENKISKKALDKFWMLLKGEESGE